MITFLGLRTSATRRFPGRANMFVEPFTISHVHVGLQVILWKRLILFLQYLDLKLPAVKYYRQCTHAASTTIKGTAAQHLNTLLSILLRLLLLRTPIPTIYLTQGRCATSGSNKHHPKFITPKDQLHLVTDTWSMQDSHCTNYVAEWYSMVLD
ncbi:hypothetical protein BO79DRAFT_223037 [Aspergillus costaricaensis CBS 115574]|uniref:Uncharacterized protein n=1 Tax=Aspergillus costaricaensis CBS 115574 TaxID=1448317 RepID=A0ACD1HY18_9EURO|nr:hypothetical protein BO79DRAFT_223037 [Aspergillus costaricaensis CBS 115574]RAK82881.1 hypothetical protein BO79DRAFT_223037 [Aspergillus costaricaensis CBS 115574]